MVLGVNLLTQGRTHRHKLKDNVWCGLKIRGTIYDLHKGSQLILSEEFDPILFSIGIKNVRDTSRRQGCHALRIIRTLRVATKDVMELLFDVNDGLTMLAKVLHNNSCQ